MNPNALRSFAVTLSIGASALLVAPNLAAEEETDAGAASGESEGAEEPPEAGDGEPPANAADGEPAAKDAAESKGLGHAGQFGLRAGLVGGLRMIVRYEKSTYCKAFDPLKEPADQQKFCGHMAPFALDLGLSFGVVDFFEPFLWGRFGLGGEEQTDTKPIVVIGAGARLYTMSDSLVKVFVEPAVALELEDGQGHVPWSLVENGYPTDLVFHLAAGPQFDVSRHLGIYVTGGITTGVIRSIHTSLDLQAGLQGRYP